jgi:chromosome segregation ATPase
LADYGDAPQAIQLTPVYAYRVFTRQRELKRRLVSISAECERAHFELETTLAELAREVRPAAEQNEQFRRFLAPLVELEQVESQHGRALSAVAARFSADSDRLAAQLGQIAARIAAQEELERSALRVHDEREAAAQRADAKLKRVHIEIRAVTHVAEQKLGPAGGQIPETEAAQLLTLRQRAEDLEPEVAQAGAALSQAKQALGQARAQLDVLRRSERATSREKQDLAVHYQEELGLRDRGSSENESQQRAALADLARAVLAAAGSVEVSAAWLERVRSANERADKLTALRELQRRASESYDALRVQQGVRLACTLLGLFVLLLVFKLIF